MQRGLGCFLCEASHKLLLFLLPTSNINIRLIRRDGPSRTARWSSIDTLHLTPARCPKDSPEHCIIHQVQAFRRTDVHFYHSRVVIFHGGELGCSFFAAKQMDGPARPQQPSSSSRALLKGKALRNFISADSEKLKSKSPTTAMRLSSCSSLNDNLDHKASFATTHAGHC